MNKTIRSACVVWLSLLLMSCAAGNKFHRDGIAASQSGDFEESIRLLREAVRQDPGNMTYRLDLKTQRERGIQTLIASGDAAKAAGDYDSADANYRRVLKIEARNGRALRGLDAVAEERVHLQMVSQAQLMFERGEVDLANAKLREVLSENPGVSAARALLEKIDAARPPVSVIPRLVTANNAPVTLQFRDADTRMVFEVLSRQTGINFIFDKDVERDGKTTIYVRNVPIEQAIDLVLGQNQLGRQILSENMVLIYPNTAVKQLEYQDQVIKTFYLTNASPMRFSEMLKTMLNAKTIFVEERSNAVVVRDTPEVIRMAENLLASIDLPESEVMMEVEVLEITRSKLEQLGIQYPTGATLTPTPLAGSPLVLADLKEQDSTTIQITPVPVTIDLKKEVGVSNLLASPRIRARNREKAKILIGQRVPVITNSVTPTSVGASVVTGSVQYVDVGLTLEVEPTIHLDNEVAISVQLEVSNIIREIFNSTSGTLAYQIGTRNASTVLRLRNGETQILAGLIQDDDRVSSNRVPGLGDMPILGRLFSSKKTNDEKTEIVLSITPRIIRAQPRPSSEHTEFWYGTESSMRSAPLATTSSIDSGGARVRSSYDTVASGSAGGSNNSNRDASDKPDSPPPKRLDLSWDGPGQVAVGEEFDVALMVDSETELASLRTELRYDRVALELSGVDVGDFLPADLRAGAKPEIQDRAGRVELDVASVENATASGQGSLVVLHFRALVPRPGTMIAVRQFAAQGLDSLAVPAVAPRPLVVVVTR
ncbi:MAG: general secretion pathway protein GspD [Gammaproteobacteria bacterium]|nr:general secretion pathway protein GspD [Gammaproteobacteria bacterium]